VENRELRKQGIHFARTLQDSEFYQVV